MDNAIPHSWLQAQIPEVTVPALIAHEIDILAPKFEIPKEKIRALVEKRPTAHWVRFLEKAQIGDELWSFSSPRASWQNLCGAAGYALVRDGAIISTIVTLRN